MYWFSSAWDLLLKFCNKFSFSFVFLAPDLLFLFDHNFHLFWYSHFVHIIFLVFFSSLYIFSFSNLSIFRTVKILPIKCNTCAALGVVLENCFVLLIEQGFLLLWLCISCDCFLKTRHWKHFLVSRVHFFIFWTLKSFY